MSLSTHKYGFIHLYRGPTNTHIRLNRVTMGRFSKDDKRAHSTR